MKSSVIYFLSWLITAAWLIGIAVPLTRCFDTYVFALIGLLCSAVSVYATLMYQDWVAEGRRKRGDIIEREKS